MLLPICVIRDVSVCARAARLGTRGPPAISLAPGGGTVVSVQLLSLYNYKPTLPARQGQPPTAKVSGSIETECFAKPCLLQYSCMATGGAAILARRIQPCSKST